MGKKINKKSRIGLSAAAGLLATSGIVAPLAMTGCATTNVVKNNAIDKEYDVSNETYEDLKTQFRVEYSNKLKKVYLETSTDYKLRMDALEEDLNAFDKTLNENNPNYTSLTQALIDFAREQKQKYPTVIKTANGVVEEKTEAYGIQLIRHTRTKWSDLNDLYSGMADSFKTYMHNSKMPASTINRILAESKAKFDDLTKQLKATYGNDALSGLLKAKEKLITFFDEVNDDIAFISACLRLKDFMSEFVFEYRDYDENGNIYLDNCLDKLQKDYPNDFAEGKVLKDEIMNKLFTLTRKTTGKTVDFDAKTIVPGYTIQPKLVAINDDNLSNTHSIDIDFGIVKNVYAQKYANDPEKLNLVTGHLYDVGDNLFDSIGYDDDVDFAEFIKSGKLRPIEYTVRLTPEEEANRLKETYFNPESEDGNISFKWTSDENEQAYEAFFDNARQNADGTWTGRLETQSLFNAGLMISENDSSYSLLKNLSTPQKWTSYINNNTFVGTFLSNCQITSTVNIRENENREVIHQFKVFYSNSIYIKNTSTSEYFNIDNNKYESKCVNFKTSNAFYEKINNKFNEATNFVLVYDESLKKVDGDINDLSEEDKKYLDGLEKKARDSLIGQISLLVGYAVSIGTFIFGIVKCWNSTKSKFWLWVGVIVLIASAILEVTSFSLFMCKYYNKLKDYVDNARKANVELKNSTLVSMLKKDLNENFVLINEDGTYDEVKFANQKAKFEKNSMSDMLNMYRKYATINQYDKNGNNTPEQEAMYEFDNILNRYNVSPEIYTDEFDDWEPGKKMWLVVFLLSISQFVLNIILSCVYVFKISRNQRHNPEVDPHIPDPIPRPVPEQPKKNPSIYGPAFDCDGDKYIPDWLFENLKMKADNENFTVSRSYFTTRIGKYLKKTNVLADLKWTLKQASSGLTLNPLNYSKIYTQLETEITEQYKVCVEDLRSRNPGKNVIPPTEDQVVDSMINNRLKNPNPRSPYNKLSLLDRLVQFLDVKKINVVIVVNGKAPL